MNIQLQNVTYTYAGKYQRVTAVDGVSYTFHDGTLYTIMGASGSGKSTLLSLLAGLKLPTEGEITLDEQPIRLMDRSALRRDTVSVIYQDFNLFPLLTAEENVCYPLRLQKMDKEKALELARQRLTDMGIRESYFRKLPNQLSGGEQQRVAIARALAAGSRVILADEPTGSLDSDNGRMIVETLQRLAHQEERCVIVVTHDPKVAEAADIRLHMQDGKLSGAFILLKILPAPPVLPGLPPVRLLPGLPPVRLLPGLRRAPPPGRPPGRPRCSHTAPPACGGGA